MLADQLDYVIGVDPHRDAHALAIVEVRTRRGGVRSERAPPTAAATREALRLAEQHAPGRRAFAVEGTGSYGAGLTRFLADHGEQVFEVGRLRRERRSGGKTDALDAVRAARSVLDAASGPRRRAASGEREALRALMAAREGAVNARTAALCQLRDLLVTTPEPLRSELRPLTRARLLSRLAATRPERRHDPELRGTQLALQSRRATHPAAHRRGTRARTRDREARPASSRRSCSTSPASARSSPPRSCSPGHTKAASPAKPPSPASPAPPRSPPPPAKRSATASTAAATAQLNRALHQILLTRRRTHPPTIDYIDRRTQEGKTRREATRCLKRYLARNLYRLLENPPIDRLDKHRSITGAAERCSTEADLVTPPRTPNSAHRFCTHAVRSVGL